MKVLFIGGTGIIGSACSELAVQRGIDLTFLNRGRSTRAVPDGNRTLIGDINDPARQVVDEELNALMEEIIAAAESAFPLR